MFLFDTFLSCFALLALDCEDHQDGLKFAKAPGRGSFKSTGLVLLAKELRTVFFVVVGSHREREREREASLGRRCCDLCLFVVFERRPALLRAVFSH